MAVNQGFIAQHVLAAVPVFALFYHFDEELILPMGFHFFPTGEELISGISCKISGLELPFGRHVQELDVYAYSPMELAEMFSLDQYGDNVHFLTRRRRGPSAQFVRGGSWRPIMGGRPISRIESSTGMVIGSLRIHHFFDENGERDVNWVMKEYIRERSDEWVMVKIIRKAQT